MFDERKDCHLELLLVIVDDGLDDHSCLDASGRHHDLQTAKSDVTCKSTIGAARQLGSLSDRGLKDGSKSKFQASQTSVAPLVKRH